MTKNLLIFDFDGVINDSIDISLKIFKQLVEKYNLDIEPTRQNYIKIFDWNLNELGKKFNLPLVKTLIIIFDAKKTLRQMENKFKLFPEMKGTLKKLSKENNLAIVTSHLRNIKKSLKRLYIEKYFDLVLKTNFRKNKSEKIKQCIDFFNANQNRTFFVTDDVKDISEAKKVGVKSIAVTWGIQTSEELLKEKPDFIIDEPSEILKIIS